MLELSKLGKLVARWGSGGIWSASAALAIVIVLGFIDPFGLRQRADWIVSDQFLRVRNAPAVHKDIFLVAIDDGAVEQFSFPLPRSVLAAVIRQLHKLEARTVLVDVLFADPQRNPVLKESETWLFSYGTVLSGTELGERLSEVKQRFTEDQVLARSMRPAGSVVIPFSFLSQETFGQARGMTRSFDATLVAKMSDILIEQPALSPAELASRLGVADDAVNPQFGPALELAMERLARQQIEANASTDEEEALAAALPPELGESYVGKAFRRAFDNAGAEKIVRDKASIPAKQGVAVRSDVATEQLKPPRYSLTDAAAALGFADIQLDRDGTLRRINLIASWKDRLLFHQSLVAVLAHQKVMLNDLRLELAWINSASGSLHVPVDRSNRVTIDWPVDGRKRWNEVIPMISLSDIHGLDEVESELRLRKHRRREFFKEITKLLTKDPAWQQQFDRIQQARRQGNIEEAEQLENQFDGEAIPEILRLSSVAEAFERARTTEPPRSNETSEPGEVQYARAIVELDTMIAQSESEYRQSFNELLPIIRDKLCLVGDTTTGSADLKRTPADEAMPGVAVIASAISTMLSGKSLTIYGYGMSALVLLLLAGGLLIPFLRLGAVVAGACAWAGVTVAFLSSYLLLATRSVFISPMTPLVGVFTVYATTTTYRWLREYREKKLVRTIFEGQTNPVVVERMLEAAAREGVDAVLTPKNRQVTVFFAEIADYDDLVQQVTTERLPEVLSRTFGTMAKLVLAHEGTLDRYQGHAMVAFFGAPTYQPDHAQRACRAALECCDTLRALESAWHDRGLPAPRVHIGLHTGELLVGNITFTSRVDYTVAGENLNVAYRIGELNEVYGTQVMMSEATLIRCENMVEARELDMVRIKGRREPIRAFELMSAKGRLTHDQSELRGAFSTGLIAYRNKDYAGALAMFRSCRATAPGDRPATVYIERCERELSATAGATAQG